MLISLLVAMLVPAVAGVNVVVAVVVVHVLVVVVIVVNSFLKDPAVSSSMVTDSTSSIVSAGVSEFSLSFIDFNCFPLLVHCCSMAFQLPVH